MDKYERPAALRRAIWTWLQAHQRATMRQIIAALCGHPGETIKGAVAAMVAHGSVGQQGGSGQVAVYWATDTAPLTAAQSRERAAEGRRQRFAERSAERTEASRAEHRRTQAERIERVFEKGRWVTRHIVKPNDAPLPRQGGQGAVDERAHIDCSQNW